MKLAKVRHRIMAALLDFAIMLAVLIVITLIKIPFIVSMLRSDEHVVTSKFIIDMFRLGIIYCVLLLIYYVVVPLLFKGQTIGKKIFKLKIVKEDNSDVDYKTMFYREGMGRIFINFASLGITIVSSVVIMSLRKDKRDLADIIAKTKVIDLYESEDD